MQDLTPVRQSLRLSGKLRGIVVVYGIAAFTCFFGKPVLGAGSGGLILIGLGLAIQLTMFIAGKLVDRYERAHGLEGRLAPTVLWLVELLADALTVLLFALATMRAISGAPDAL